MLPEPGPATSGPPGREQVYDHIGGQYVRGRQPDPRIAARIWAPLADAASIVNVGAGAGSYEPEHRRVVAVEPSMTMLTQRPAGAAPAVRALAEGLPFGDRTFDAAMAVLTVRHWRDRRRGLAELRRVTAGPVVLFLRDPAVVESWWLHHYFPATARLEAARETPLADVAWMLGSRLAVTEVPIPADCRDGFNGAYWRRPRDLLDPRVWRSMSALAQIPEPDRVAGMRRLRADLDSGEWDRRWGHLRALAELDLGYRVVTARRAASTKQRPGKSGQLGPAS